MTSDNLSIWSAEPSYWNLNAYHQPEDNDERFISYLNLQISEKTNNTPTKTNISTTGLVRWICFWRRPPDRCYLCLGSVAYFKTGSFGSRSCLKCSNGIPFSTHLELLNSIRDVCGLWLLTNGVYWGYNPLTNHLLTSWDIQVGLHSGMVISNLDHFSK